MQWKTCAVCFPPHELIVFESCPNKYLHLLYFCSGCHLHQELQTLVAIQGLAEQTWAPSQRRGCVSREGQQGMGLPHPKQRGCVQFARAILDHEKGKPIFKYLLSIIVLIIFFCTIYLTKFCKYLSCCYADCYTNETEVTCHRACFDVHEHVQNRWIQDSRRWSSENPCGEIPVCLTKKIIISYQDK